MGSQRLRGGRGVGEVYTQGTEKVTCIRKSWPCRYLGEEQMIPWGEQVRDPRRVCDPYVQTIVTRSMLLKSQECEDHSEIKVGEVMAAGGMRPWRPR